VIPSIGGAGHQGGHRGHNNHSRRTRPGRRPLNFTERAAIAGFLAGYTGNTLVSFTTDVRLFAEWCTNNDLAPLDVRRAHLEIFGRMSEADGRMRSTVARRLSTLGSFYRHCSGLLADTRNRLEVSTSIIERGDLRLDL
jgi:hypothetical protein